MNSTAREQAEQRASLRAPALGTDTVTVFLTADEVRELMYGLSCIPAQHTCGVNRAALFRKMELVSTYLPAL